MDFMMPIPNRLLLCYSLQIPLWLWPLCFEHKHSCFLFPNIYLVALPRGFYCGGLQRLRQMLGHCVLSGFILLQYVGFWASVQLLISILKFDEGFSQRYDHISSLGGFSLVLSHCIYIAMCPVVLIPSSCRAGPLLSVSQDPLQQSR